MIKWQYQKLLINRKCPNPLMFLQGVRYTSGVRPADLLAASMAAEPSLPHTCKALVGFETGHYHANAHSVRSGRHSTDWAILANSANYRPQTKSAKVTFLQVSVCLEGGVRGCWRGACMVAGGGCAWLLVAGGVRGERGRGGAWDTTTYEMGWMVTTVTFPHDDRKNTSLSLSANGPSKLKKNKPSVSANITMSRSKSPMLRLCMPSA